jgi:exodeoxyribonuclease V alpha subunit
LYQGGIISALDVHFANFLEKMCGGFAPALWLAAALASSYTREGHICLDLPSVARTSLLEPEDIDEPLICPELGEWRDKLIKSDVVGEPGQYKPLVLDDKARLYLFRYWEYQERLADLIESRIQQPDGAGDMVLLKQGLVRAFPERSEEVDWQKVAACVALLKRFSVISGGPGTGKTTTVAKIMALLLEQNGTKGDRIALVSPTGKGAVRLQQAIKRAKESLDFPESIRTAIPEEASTIHRLLGSIPDSPYFRYHAGNRLSLDAMVVDEASMVDLALMSKLVQALPLEARLILLGDRDQLASVEAGAILGDICDTGNPHGFSRPLCRDIKKITGYRIRTEERSGPEIRDCIVQLRRSYRFGRDSGIAAISHAVNAGDVDSTVTSLREGRYKDILWRDLPAPDDLAEVLKKRVIQPFQDGLRVTDPQQVFELFERFRILCALREGPYGVIAVNAMVEQILKRGKLIRAEGRWYNGRPIMITRNDYDLRLYNGDVGVVLEDPSAGHDLRAFFPATDGTVRKLHPLRLPEHETVYAMTVHKSQGSEFDRVLLLLPERDFPVLTRELVYTGMTRARKAVEIWGHETVFRQAISRRTERTSGLRDALWEVDEGGRQLRD